MIFEIKSSISPLRGAVNGHWQRRTATGWITTRNYYQQALSQKHAVRDGFSAFLGTAVTYPDCAIVYAPHVPVGSDIPGSDFKVAAIATSDVTMALNSRSGSPWPLEGLRRFAYAQGLIPTKTVDAACSPAIYTAEQRIRDYKAELARFYATADEHYIVTKYTIDGAPVSLSEMLPLVDRRHALLLNGPSGCGKTMLARRMAIAAVDNYLPIYLQAKNFSGTLAESINAEVTLLGAPSAISIIKYARLLGQRIVLIVDAFNECSEDLRSDLIRALSAAARRYDSITVLTTNTDVVRADLMPMAQVEVHAPTFDERKKIAAGPNGNTLSHDVLLLLGSVATGLEAALLGEIGDAILTGASRFILFDAFMRRRSGKHASDIIRLLAKIADRLLDNLSFSLSVREVERLAEASNIPTVMVEHARSVGLLAQHRDRVSFRHELFLNAAATEAVVRRAPSAVAIIQALRLPQHSSQRVLIIGAIEQPALLSEVLGCVEDPEILQSCLDGECGVEAKALVSRDIDDVLRKAIVEVGQLTFTLEKDSMWSVAILPASILSWTNHEAAVISALPSAIWSEPALSLFLEGMRAIDERIALARIELREAAKEQNLSSIYTGVFAACHLFSQCSGTAMARISSILASGMARINQERDMSAAFSHIYRSDLSPGELYVLLAMFRGSGLETYARLAAVLPRLFAERWLGAPYHLKLDMLDACHKCWKAPEADRLLLLDTLQGLKLPEFSGLNSVWIDALGALGALEDDEQNHAVHLRILMRAVLDNPQGEDQYAQAWHLYYGQFDHPYASAYCEVVSELTVDEKKVFLSAAAQAAAKEDSDLFTVPLIMELAKFDDPSLAPLIAPWTRPPRKDSMMPNEAIGAFRCAWIALGRLGYDFEFPLPASSEASTFALYGRILYWLNRADIEPGARESKARGVLDKLTSERVDLVIGIIADSEYWDSGTVWESLNELKGAPTISNIRQVFGPEVADVSRKYLAFCGTHRSYFKFPDIEKWVDYSLQILGLYGSAMDIALLKRFAHDRRRGRSALAAIKAIEDRLYV